MGQGPVPCPTLTWDILQGEGVVIGAARNGETTNYTYGLERISAISGKTRTEYVYDGRGSVAAEISYNDSWYSFGGVLAKKNVTMESEMVFRANANEEMYLKSVSKEGDKKEESTIYLVKDAKYKQVLYLDMYDEDTKKNEKTVYGYDGNELTFSFAALYFLAPTMYTSMFLDPNTISAEDLLEETAEDSEAEYTVESKYYSKGDGNLTLKINAKEGAKSEDEYAVSESYTVVYDNYYWKSAVIEGESNKGNKSKAEITFTVKDEVKIELPSGWESLINKEAA